MKKFFDRYLFSKMGLQILFSVVLILIFSWLVTVVRSAVLGGDGNGTLSQALWGFRQFVDSGAIVETIDNLDDIGKKSAFGVPVMMIVTLVAWLMGIVLCGFVTGAIVNAFDGRREKIATGKTRYKFYGHGIVIGWDYQGVGAVRGMFDKYRTKEVVILSTTDVDQIQTELSEAFSAEEQKRIYVYNGVVGDDEQLKELYPQRAKAIVILGDDNAENNDGSNLCIANMINGQIASTNVVKWFNFWVYAYDKCQRHTKAWKFLFKEYDVTKGALFKDPESFTFGMKILYRWWWIKSAFLVKFEYIQSNPIDCYVDISNDYSIDQIEKIMPKGSMAGRKCVNFKGFNFCREAVNALLGDDVELAFRHNPEADKVRILISGFNGMARALIKNVRACVPSDVKLDVKIFAQDAADELDKFLSVNPALGFDVELIETDICSRDVRQKLVSVVQDISSSVNIFMLDDSPDGTLELFCRLPDEIAYENIRIYFEQRTFRKWSPQIKRKGFPSVRKFGFVDEYQKFLMDGKASALAKKKEGKETFTAVSMSFKDVIGVFNGFSDANWEERGNTIYSGLVSTAAKIKVVDSAIAEWNLNKNKRSGRGKDVVFLLSLDSFASYEIARMAYEYGVPYVLVFSQKMVDAVDAVADERKRAEFARIVRNAYSYLVDADPQKYVLLNSSAVVVGGAYVDELKKQLLLDNEKKVRKLFVVSNEENLQASAASLSTVVNNVSEIML